MLLMSLLLFLFWLIILFGLEHLFPFLILLLLRLLPSCECLLLLLLQLLLIRLRVLLLLLALRRGRRRLQNKTFRTIVCERRGRNGRKKSKKEIFLSLGPCSRTILKRP